MEGDGDTSPESDLDSDPESEGGDLSGSTGQIVQATQAPERTAPTTSQADTFQARRENILATVRNRLRVDTRPPLHEIQMVNLKVNKHLTVFMCPR